MKRAHELAGLSRVEKAEKDSLLVVENEAHFALQVCSQLIHSVRQGLVLLLDRVDQVALMDITGQSALPLSIIAFQVERFYLVVELSSLLKDGGDGAAELMPLAN